MENFNSYDDNKKDGKIYIGRQIINKDGSSYRKAEAISDFGMTYTENLYEKNELNSEERRYLRILNSSYHNLQIMTYQQLLQMAKNILTIEQSN